MNRRDRNTRRAHCTGVRTPPSPLCGLLAGLACSASEPGSRYPGDARETIEQACVDGLDDPKRCDSTCHNAQLNALLDCPEADDPPLDELHAYAECRGACDPVEVCSDGSKVVACDCELACLEDASPALLDTLAFSRDCAADLPECGG